MTCNTLDSAYGGTDCPQTQAFYESLGIRCHPTPVDELGKAAGAIGCLSRVVGRELV